MKRRHLVVSILLGAASLALAAVPSALASHTTAIDVQSATLFGGGITLSGAVACTEGYQWYGFVDVRQRTAGNEWNVAGTMFGGTCASTGPEPFTVTVFGTRPFHPGPATLQAFASVCDPVDFHCATAGQLEEIRVSGN